MGRTGVQLLLLLFFSWGATSVYGAALIGLVHDRNSAIQHLAEVDPSDGSTLVFGGGIADCCEVTGAAMAFDQAASALYFVGRGFGDADWNLYTLDTGSGNLSDTQTLGLAAGSALQFLTFHGGALYGVSFDPAGSAQLVTVNRSNGSLNPVGSALGNCCSVAAGVSALSPTAAVLYFIARPPDETDWRIYTLSLTTGSLVTDPVPLLPNGVSPDFLEFDDNDGILYLTYHDSSAPGQRLAQLSPTTGVLSSVGTAVADCCTTKPGVSALSDSSADSVLYGTGRPFAEDRFQIQSYSLANGSLSAQSLSDLYAFNGLFLSDDSILDTPVAIASSVNPSVFGQAVSFTATVGGSNPSGQVDFFDGSTFIGTCALSAGQCQITTATLGAGVHAISAHYPGDGGNNPGSSPGLDQAVDPAFTNTVVDVSPGSGVAGQSFAFTARVDAQAPGAGTPTGTVDFYSGMDLLGSAPLVNGTAMLSASLAEARTHSISAVYAGSTDFAISTSAAVDVNVAPGSTSTALASSANPAGLGQAVIFTAMVSAIAPAAGTPTGVVSFRANGNPLGNVSLDASGKARFTTATLAAGNHAITAAYQGSLKYSASTSALLNQSVIETKKIFTGPTATGTGVATVLFTGSDDCGFTEAEFIPLVGHPGSPAMPFGFGSFPHGLFRFRVENCTPGSSVDFTIHYPAPEVQGMDYWKFGPTPDEPRPHWYLLPSTTTTDTTSFTIVDGGLGDSDLMADGTFIDPGGPVAGQSLGIPLLGNIALGLLILLFSAAGVAAVRLRP